jgi:hypothetical protein
MAAHWLPERRAADLLADFAIEHPTPKQRAGAEVGVWMLDNICDCLNELAEAMLDIAESRERVRAAEHNERLTRSIRILTAADIGLSNPLQLAKFLLTQKRFTLRERRIAIEAAEAALTMAEQLQ